MRRPALGFLALAFAGACALPTESPNWDVVWNLPLPDSGQTISVTSFLPNGVSVIGSGATAAFRANVSSVPPINRTLGVQCPTCPNATAQKPLFSAPISTTTISLTSGTALNSGTLSAGSQIVLALNNGFTFDPIRPPGGSPGTVTLTVNNGAATLGTTTLQGATSAIPAGQITSVTIPLSGTINTASPITVSMTMDSPAGDPAQPVSMNPNHPFTVNATPTINVSQATVTIAAQPLVPNPQDLDLTSGPIAEIGSRIADSATVQGSMFMIITNPMSLGANGTITFTGMKAEGESSPVPITPVVKALAIPAGSAASPTSTVRIDFTGEELRRLVGSSLTVTITGSTLAGSTTVTPASSITIFTRLQVRLFVKELE